MPTPITKSINPNPTKKTQTEKDKKYSDPLNNWVLRGLACTNEIGVTISEIAPKASVALWIPTFMYLGADIYDKYKNDKNHYSPSGRRGIEHGIAQGISTFILPAVAILLGQRLTSPVGRFFDDRISINAKDTVIRHTKDVLDQSVGKYFDNKEHFKTILANSLDNKIRSREGEKHTNNIFRKIHKFFRGDYAITTADKAKLTEYTNKNADMLFEIKEKLIKNERHPELPKRIFNKYRKSKPLMQKMYGADFADQALRTALKEYQNSLIVKNKLLKTLGGLISLALLIKPIDVFVNKTLLPKYIAPGVDIVRGKLHESNQMRLHVKTFNDYHSLDKTSIESEKIPKVYLSFLG